MHTVKALSFFPQPGVVYFGLPSQFNSANPMSAILDMFK